MCERKKALSLVPAAMPVVHHEELSTGQIQDVAQAARTYLKNQKIVITDKTFPLAIRVLEDAAARQLHTEARPVIGQSEKVAGLINKGLETRENIRRDADTTINLTRKNPTTDGELTGPYALRINLYNETVEELRTFPLRPQIAACEQIAATTSERRFFLNHFAGFALSNLPPELSGVTIERFPTPEEQSKLVRNMVASFVFRNSLSPLITVSDLKEFVELNYKHSGHFIPEKKEALIAAMGELSLREKAYISDLFDQTKEAFSPYRPVPDEDNLSNLDKFYQLFSRDLLLLHPALEEQQLISSPDEVTLDVITIWDEGLILEGAWVATPELLARARRQATARKDGSTGYRLAEGMRWWKWLDTAGKQHEEKVRGAAQGLREREELLLSIQDPTAALPREAYLIRYKIQKEVREDARSLRRKAGSLTNIIAENDRQQQEAREYEKWIAETYGNLLPFRLLMPRGVFIDNLRAAERSALLSRAATQGLVVIAAEVLRRDFFLGEAVIPIGILPPTDTQLWIEQTLASTEEDLYGLAENQNRFTYNPGISRKALEYTLLQEERRRFRYKPLEALGELNKFWSGSGNRLRDIDGVRREGFDEPRVLWAEFVTDALKHRINALHYTSSLIDRRNDQDKRLEEARKEYSLYIQDPERELPASANWLRTEALGYLKEMRVADLPNLSLQDLAKLGPLAQQLRAVLQYDFPIGILPKHIPHVDMFISEVSKRRNLLAEQAREWLGKYIGGTTKEAEKKAREKRKSRRIESLERQIEIADTVLKYTGSVLIPIEEGSGLERSSFVTAWRRRVALVYANAYKEEITAQSTQEDESYEDLTRDLFIQTLSREIEARRRGLESLRQRNVTLEFIHHMKSLGLVL